MYERLRTVEALEHRLQLSVVNVSILDGTAQESAGTLALQITFDASPTSDVELFATTSDGTATAGTHYTALVSEPFTIPMGADPTIPLYLYVTIFDDVLDNNDRTFNVSITSNSNPDVTILDGDAIATIDNDDDPTVMTDTDSDTETDTDSDSDSDSGSDTDTDTDSNTDSETDTDSDSDSDTNSDTDTDSDTDSDSDADTTNLAPEFDDPDDPDVYDLPFLYGDERGVVGHGGDVGTFNASDPNSDALTFSVLGDIPLPYELVATGNSATLRLIPGARAVGGTFSIQVQVADNGSPALTDVATVNWTVTGTGIGTCDAVDDSYTVTGNSVSPASYLFMILQNDVDSNGGSPNRLKVSGLTVPQHGTVRSVGGTHVVYTPNAGYTGEDWFLYQVEDNATLGRDWARVSVTVNPNVAPDLPADLAFFHRINTSYVGSVPELAGDTDPLIWSITPGTPFKINQSGSISVDSAAPPIIPGATYSVTVTASDGEFSDSCTVTIRVSKAPVIENDFHHVYIDLPRTFNVGDIITTVPYEQVDPEDNGPGGVSYYTSNQLVFDAVAGAAGGVDIVRSWTAVNAAALDGTSITLTVYDKDGDDTVTIHFHAKDYLPPAFSDNTYSFAVVSENTDGNVIGYVQATDPQGLALSYTVPPALEGKIEIAFGAVMLVDAADVLSLISTSGGSSGGHQITVTNLAGLSDTATLTLNAANPTVLNNQVQDYINTWESRALTRSDNIKDEAVTVINNNFSDLKAKVVNEATSRIDMADLFFAFADFVPSPLAAGLSDIGQAVLQMVVHAKEENESAALSVQQAAAVAKAGKLNVQEEGKIVQAAADKRNAWNNFLATNPTQLKMQEWFTDLQAEWPLP